MEKTDFSSRIGDYEKPAFMTDTDLAESDNPQTRPTPTQAPEDIWKIVVENLRMHVSARDMNIWYKDVYLSKIENGVAEISCDTQMKREWIESNHRNFIKNQIENVIGYKPDLVISIRSAISRDEPTKAKYEFYNPQQGSSSDPFTMQGTMFDQPSNSTAQAEPDPEQANLNPQYTLDSFVVGASNQLAFAVAEGVIENPGYTYNPVFFYGPSGVGKTHLMQAIGNSMLMTDPTSKILYVPIETFMNEMIEAIRTRKNEEFRQRYRPVDLLIIDDIQFISTYKKTQEELFNTFNSLYQSNKQIVIASDRPPKEIENLPDRLRTRFEGGMVVDVQAPDFETRVAIVQQKVEKLKVNFPDNYIKFIAHNVDRSVRELEGAVTKVATQMKFAPQELDEESLAKMLQVDIATKRRRIKPENIMDAVCETFSVTIGDITGKRRTAHIATSRQVTMYLMREILELPLEQIAKSVNRKDHTTVIHACSKIESLIKEDQNFSKKLDSTIELIQK